MSFKLSIIVFTLLVIAICSDASPVRNEIVKIDKVESMNTELSNLVRDETDGKDSSADEKDDKDDKKKDGHEGHDHDSDKEGKDDKEKDDDKKDDDKKDDEDSADDSPAESGSGIGGVPVGAQAGNPVCFPGSAMVSLENGNLKKMSDIEVGDVVAVGQGKFSAVFMFTHRINEGSNEFVQLTVKDGAVLRATEGHHIYVNGKSMAAALVAVGDTVQREDGVSVVVTKVERVRDVGLFNPQTLHGDIIVDGIRTTTYTTAVEQSFAHAALAPLRALFDGFKIVCTAFENGASNLAALVPSA